MAVQQGLDPERVAALADRLATEGERLTQIHTTGTAMMGTLAQSWAGPDLAHFRDTWHHSAPQIHAMAASLRAAARELHEQARAQVEASGQSGTGTAGGGAAGSTKAGAPGPARSGDRSPWDGLTDYGRNLLVPDDKMLDTAKKFADRARDGIEEGVDRVNEGMDWVGDRAQDARDWGQDKAERLADASLEAAEQLLFSGSAVFVGRGLLSVGEKVLGWDDGHGEAGDVTELSTTDSTNGHPKARQPTSLEAIMRSTSDAYQNDGHVRITEITRPDGTSAYIVNVPGTQPWSTGSTDNPLDSLGNLGSINGDSTAATEAVRDAMEKAGIPPGSPVLMASHSQGGMISQSLLSDPSFTERFNVTHSVTYGSPVDAIPDTSEARQLHLQHRGDVVPRVDLGNAPKISRLDDDASVVTLDNPATAWAPDPTVNDYPGMKPLSGPPVDDIKQAHSHENYADSVAASDDPRIADFENDLDEFIVPEGDTSKVTAVDVEIRRRK